jgi:cathepsin A (carboxypeptidase C)/serine carboxypeptidase-like clade 2
VGLYTEMGYFQLSDQGSYVNEYAWNLKANMLYLESPAGSGDQHGYSQCLKAGAPVTCHWDDVSQGEAYAHTLAAFHAAFPEFASNDFYLTGESYFGQCTALMRPLHFSALTSDV